MYLLTAKITIYSEKTWTFEKVKEVKIERDTDSLTDTCTITLPRKVKWKDEKTVPVKIGEKVSVELGYNNELQPAFSGYITKISVRGALVIKCEDEMYLLKWAQIKVKTYETATVSQVLKDQLPDMQIKVCGDQALGAYRVPSNTRTVSQLLDGLRTNGFKVFFRYDESDKPTLWCGKSLEAQGERAQVFDSSHNITGTKDLVDERTMKEKVLVRGISISSLNKDTIEQEVGEEGGMVKILTFYQKTEAEVNASIQQELENHKRNGLSGSFTALGSRLVDKLDTIGLILDGEKYGQYLVAKNTITYNKEGFQQNITLGNRVD